MNTKSLPVMLLLTLGAAILHGCSNTTAPSAAPAPRTVSGMTRDRINYTFLQWDEGLAVMLVDRCEVHHMSGSNDAGEPCRQWGNAYALDPETNEWKDGYEWQIATSDGRAGALTINNVAFDLAKGALFRIETGGDRPHVQQFDTDLSNVRPDRQSCDNFVSTYPALRPQNMEPDAE